MSPLKFAIAGASGRMGRMLIEAVVHAPDMQLTAAFDMPNSPHLQASKTKAQFLIEIAENDDKRSPNEKNVLRETFDNRRFADTGFTDFKTIVSRLELEKYKATVKGLTQFGDRREGIVRVDGWAPLHPARREQFDPGVSDGHRAR